MQTCIGTGILAIPYATHRGGMVVGPAICALIAVWNSVACAMMIECKNYVQHIDIPSHLCISSTYSRMAYAGLGRLGVVITDTSVVVTLLGVCVAYQITFSSLLSSVQAVDFSGQMLTLISGVFVLPLCLSSSFSSLAALSLLGLVCLCVGSIAIIYFGFCSYGSDVYRDPFSQLSATPASSSDLASFVGIATFCFGLPPLAFPLQESMRDKSKFNLAVAAALVFVWVFYVLIGDLGALFYVHSPQGVLENVLSDLPVSSPLALSVRVCMAMVCILTFPLTFLPPAQMIEKYFEGVGKVKAVEVVDRIATMEGGVKSAQYGSFQGALVGADSNSDSEELSPLLSSSASKVSPMFSYVLRCVLVLLCTSVAVFVPCFATVISVLGALTVALLSFVLPPLLHLTIISYPRYMGGNRGLALNSDWSGWQVSADVVLLVCGLLLTVLTTCLILIQAAAKFSAGLGC